MPIATAVPSRKPRAGSSRSQSRALRSLDNRSVAQPSDNTEVIVISSDSEDDALHSPPSARKRSSPDLRGTSQNVRPSKTRKTHKDAARSHAKSMADICELSSDDEKDDVIVTLRKRVRELEEQLESAQRSSQKALEYAQSQSLKSLEDDIACEICANPMWSPLLLPQCGHVFCAQCLLDWLDTEHKRLGPGRAAPVRQGPPVSLRTLQQYPHIAQVYPDLLQLATAPNGASPYTCPHCRTPVTSRPIEPFTLTHIVRKVAKSNGEASPSRQRPGGAAVGSNGRMWDRFFPPL